MSDAEIRTLQGTTVEVATKDLEALDHTLRGELVRPGEPPYPRRQNSSDFWVQSMNGGHQMPNRINAAEKAPSMIW